MTALKNNLTLFFQGSSRFFAGRLFGEGVNYLAFVLVARWFGIETTGIFFLGLSILTVTCMFSRCGMDGTMVKFVSEYLCKNNLKRIHIILTTSLTTVLAVSVTLVLFWFILQPFVIRSISSNEAFGLMSVMIVGLPFISMASIMISATRGTKDVKYHVFLMFLLFPTSFLALMILFFLLNYGGSSPFTAYFIAILLLFLAAFFVAKRLFGITFRLSFSRSHLTKMFLSYSFPLWISSLLSLLFLRTDLFFIAHFFDEKILGVYSSGIKTAALISVFLTVSNFVIAPLFAEMHARKRYSEMKYMFQIVNKWIFLLSLLCMTGLIFFADLVLSLFKIKTEDGLIMFIILGFSQLINAMGGPVGTILMMTHSQKFLMKNDFLIYLAHLIILPFLIGLYGAAGAAAATCLSIFFVNLSRSVKVYRTLAVHTFNRHTVRLFLMGSAVLALSVWLRFQHSTGFSIFEALVSFSVIVAFLMVFFTFFCLQSEDKELVNWIMRRSNEQ